MALISFWFFLPSFCVCFWNSYLGGGFFEKSFENQFTSFTLLFSLSVRGGYIVF